MDVNNEYGVLQVQKDLLELLKEFDQFCLTNDIKYSVIGGTLLGAIRHKGFIPWDDDLDIVVDRRNYNKIVSLLPQNKLDLESDNRIKLWIDRIKLHRDIDGDNRTEFIDVFILDNRPDNNFKAFIKLSLVKILQGMIKPCPHFGKHSPFQTLLLYTLHILGVFLSFKTKIRLYQYLSSWENGKKTKYKMIYNDEYSLLSKQYSSDLLDSLVRLPFEDMKVYGIEKFDEYLSYIYGDYMTPPDNNSRLPKHKYLWNVS